MAQHRFKLLQMIQLIRFVPLEEDLHIWRHIAELSRSHCPEGHGFGFQKPFKNRTFATVWKHHGLTLACFSKQIEGTPSMLSSALHSARSLSRMAANKTGGSLAVMIKPLATVPLVLAFFVGCAAVGGPPEDIMKRVPVVEIGKSEPADKNYVLYVPAGKTIPIRLTVKGPLVLHPGEASAQIQLTQGLYIYKEWSSIDGINWTHQAFAGRISLGLAPKGGIVDIYIDRPN